MASRLPEVASCLREVASRLPNLDAPAQDEVTAEAQDDEEDAEHDEVDPEARVLHV